MTEAVFDPRAMYDDDAAAQLLGIELVEVGEGTAVTRMSVRPDMVNGHDVCHGGVIFTLADTAFAYACNSYGPVTFAAGASIEFLAPGRGGAVLTATAHESYRQGKNGHYDVEVVDDDGTTLALFRGRSRTVS
ncbi:MAG: hydroxyphenylacetyl-CoA thioesterase PaaI [Actinomycetota bacterium]